MQRRGILTVAALATAAAGAWGDEPPFVPFGPGLVADVASVHGRVGAPARVRVGWAANVPAPSDLRIRWAVE
jgi:hypothetical protein